MVSTKLLWLVPSVMLVGTFAAGCGSSDDSGPTDTTTGCTPTQEVCDGQDNDCDNAIDEDDKGQALTQACKDKNGQDGTQICTAGAWGACKSDCTPSPEVCDGKDNDCDGTIDNNPGGKPLTQDCSTKCGLGTEVCVNGSWENCTAKQPEKEICDGVDNDCNGKTDDGFECAKGSQENCGTDRGTCEFGTKVCGDTCTWGACLGGTTPAKEVCEGSKDEDCDGTVDNGCKCTDGDKKQCCGGTEITCTNGTMPSCPTPPTETCNHKDDDCDGTTDEDLPATPYQQNEQVSGVDDCAHAATITTPVMEGAADPTTVTDYLYRADGKAADRDFFLLRADDAFDFCSIGDYECYTVTFKMTKKPTESDYDFCVYDVGYEGSGATCSAPEQKKICASDAAPFDEVTVHYEGTCGISDDRYMYLEVFSKKGIISCDPYTISVENADNTPQSEHCTF